MIMPLRVRAKVASHYLVWAESALMSVASPGYQDHANVSNISAALNHIMSSQPPESCWIDTGARVLWEDKS
jgi:hypothetical protein